MSGYSLPNTQAAMLTAMLAHGPLTTLVATRVWDHVPQDEIFPYIHFGEHTSVPWDDKTAHGMNLTILLHIWSQYPGRKEITDIMKVLYDLFHDVPSALTVTGQQVVLIKHEFEDYRKDVDGKTWHGVQRYRILTTES